MKPQQNTSFKKIEKSTGTYGVGSKKVDGTKITSKSVTEQKIIEKKIENPDLVQEETKQVIQKPGVVRKGFVNQMVQKFQNNPPKTFEKKIVDAPSKKIEETGHKIEVLPAKKTEGITSQKKIVQHPVKKVEQKVQKVEIPPQKKPAEKKIVEAPIKKIEEVVQKKPPMNQEKKIENVFDPDKPLPNIQKIQFQKEIQKMLQGKSSKQKGGQKDGLNIKEQDCFENIGIVSLWYQNSCYTDGRYNNNNYKVEKGVLGNKVAYKIYPPAFKFKEFLASRHCLSFKLGEATDYTVYKFEENSLDLAAQILKKNVKPNSWNLVTDIKISELLNPIVYILLPSQQRLTPFASLGKDIEGATIFKDQKISIQLIKYPLPAEPPIPEDFTHGPGGHYNCYNPNRNFFRIFSKGKEYIVWGKTQTYLTQIDRKIMKIHTIQIKDKMANSQLAAACGNDEFFFYARVESGESPQKDGTRKMDLVKCDYNGVEKKRQKVSTDKQNLNIYSFDSCQLAIDGNTIGMIVSRKMTKSADGLNHQGAYAAIFDATTLKPIKKFGQTSGHSFANTLIAKVGGGGFMGMDLGDNYPRAINHWTFDSNAITFKHVYCFKTEHGKQPKSPAGVQYPPYPEISTQKNKYYKWSNDNRTYTELAAPGVIEHQSGNIIIFAGENYPSPLDSSNVGDYNNSPRNIGFVKTSKNLKEPIISVGPQEKGGFFTFNGAWQQLTNKGINWLTKLPQQQNASRVKAVGFKNKVFIIFEAWTKNSYINTQYMLADINGNVIVQNTVIPYKIRLQKSDDIYSTPHSVVIYAGSKGKLLNRYEIFES